MIKIDGLVARVIKRRVNGRVVFAGGDAAAHHVGDGRPFAIRIPRAFGLIGGNRAAP